MAEIADPELKKWIPSINKESGSLVFLTILMKTKLLPCEESKFYLNKKAFLLSISTENMIVLSPSQIMSATNGVKPS